LICICRPFEVFVPSVGSAVRVGQSNFRPADVISKIALCCIRQEIKEKHKSSKAFRQPPVMKFAHGYCCGKEFLSRFLLADMCRRGAWRSESSNRAALAALPALV
jgi:hypothetical protein